MAELVNPNNGKRIYIEREFSNSLQGINTTYVQQFQLSRSKILFYISQFKQPFMYQ